MVCVTNCAENSVLGLTKTSPPIHPSLLRKCLAASCEQDCSFVFILFVYLLVCFFFLLFILLRFSFVCLFSPPSFSFFLYFLSNKWAGDGYPVPRCSHWRCFHTLVYVTAGVIQWGVAAELWAGDGTEGESVLDHHLLPHCCQGLLRQTGHQETGLSLVQVLCELLQCLVLYSCHQTCYWFLDSLNKFPMKKVNRHNWSVPNRLAWLDRIWRQGHVKLLYKSIKIGSDSW